MPGEKHGEPRRWDERAGACRTKGESDDQREHEDDRCPPVVRDPAPRMSNPQQRLVFRIAPRRASLPSSYPLRVSHRPDRTGMRAFPRCRTRIPRCRNAVSPSRRSGAAARVHDEWHCALGWAADMPRSLKRRLWRWAEIHGIDALGGDRTKPQNSGGYRGPVERMRRWSWRGRRTDVVACVGLVVAAAAVVLPINAGRVPDQRSDQGRCRRLVGGPVPS